MRWLWPVVFGGCGSEWPSDWADFEDDVLRLTNEARDGSSTCGGGPQRGGLPPLEDDDVLREVARNHSEDMVSRQFFAHENPDGDTVAERLEDALFTGAYPWGENLALRAPEPAAVVDGWMGSPGHCENIMNGDFTVLGVGYVLGEEGALWTQVFAGSHSSP